MIVHKRGQLVELMKELELPLTAVECGVAEGRFSRELIDGGIELLYLIDIWERIPFIDGCASFNDEWHNDNYETVKNSFKDEIAKGVVVPLKGFTYKMAKFIPDNSLGLCYVDGDHSYKGVRTDIDYFLPKLVTGGIMAFHDFKGGYGVEAAVWDYTKGDGIVEIPEDGKAENIGAYFIKK